MHDGNVNGAGWCSGELLRSLKNTGNVNGIILPGVQAGRWKVINLFFPYCAAVAFVLYCSEN
jgi:hypothetical protein